MAARGRTRLYLWVGFILFIVVPWTGVQDHTHWSRVRWVPFVSPPRRLFDIVANVALYVPLGYLFVQQMSSRGDPIWRLVAFAASLSLLTESSQLYSHWRYPSLTDVTCNVLGAYLGLRLFARRSGPRFASEGSAAPREETSAAPKG